jgi:hypothetical protein
MTEYAITWRKNSVQATLTYNEESAAQIGGIVQNYIDGVYEGDVAFELDDGTKGRSYMTPEMALYYKSQMIENGTWVTLGRTK